MVQRSPNVCPKIYVVLYFVSPQIDGMYISEDQSPECDDDLGGNGSIFQLLPSDTRAPYMGMTSYPLSLPGSFILLSVLVIQAFSDMEEIVWLGCTVLVQQFVYKVEQIPISRLGLQCFTGNLSVNFER